MPKKHQKRRKLLKFFKMPLKLPNKLMKELLQNSLPPLLKEDLTGESESESHNDCE